MPTFVQQEFDACLKCGRLEHGFLRVRCTSCRVSRSASGCSVPFPLRFLFATEPAALTAVLGIVYRAIATHLIRTAGLNQSTDGVYKRSSASRSI